MWSDMLFPPLCQASMSASMSEGREATTMWMPPTEHPALQQCCIKPRSPSILMGSYGEIRPQFCLIQIKWPHV